MADETLTKDIPPQATGPKPHRFDESVEDAVITQVYNQEWEMAEDSDSTVKFESVIDMLECKRTEKDYDWQSDIFVPELASITQTDISGCVSQYFQTRDFVEVKLDGEDPADNRRCAAVKKAINKSLNRKGLYYYQKFVRAKGINNLNGTVYALCWWEKDVQKVKTGSHEEVRPLDVDIFGNPMDEYSVYPPATTTETVDDYRDQINRDHFCFDIIDPRNVRTDKKYAYSIQEKDWITIRSEVSYEDLSRDQGQNHYFNLDLVRDLQKHQGNTDASKETYAHDNTDLTRGHPVVKYFDKLLRFGRMYVTQDEGGGLKPGYDKSGDMVEGAELANVITEVIISGTDRILIRFERNPFRDGTGQPYYPLIRGICYVHPTKDEGLSDGKYLREIQKGINDNFNMGSDRVKFATIPVLQGNKYQVGEDNPTIKFEPGNLMLTETGDGQVINEFRASDNIDGMLAIHQMLTSNAQQVTAIYPTTMGDLPQKTSTTATAIAGAESRTSVRSTYKNLTFEYTFLTELYWMVIQMVYQFSEQETAFRMMGRDATFFDPNPDYTYAPLTGAIEQEYSKRAKLQIIDQIIGRLVAYPNPRTTTMLNALMARFFELLGDEWSVYSKFLLDERYNPGAEGGMMMQNGNMMGTGAPNQNLVPGRLQGGSMAMAPMSNQNGMPMSQMEQGHRMAIAGGR